MKAVRKSSDLEGMKAYTYSLRNNMYTLPTAERGSGGAVAGYKMSFGWNESYFAVRKDSKGQLRLFKGEDGRNGVCQFLD